MSYDSDSSESACCCCRKRTSDPLCELVRLIDARLEDAAEHLDVVIMDAVPVTPGPPDTPVIETGELLLPDLDEDLNFLMDLPEDIDIDNLRVSQNMIQITPNNDIVDIPDIDIVTTTNQATNVDDNNNTTNVVRVKQNVKYRKVDRNRLRTAMENGNQIAIDTTLQITRKRADGSEIVDNDCVIKKRRLFRYEPEAPFARIGYYLQSGNILWYTDEEIYLPPPIYDYRDDYIDQSLHMCPYIFDLSNIVFKNRPQRGRFESYNDEVTDPFPSQKILPAEYSVDTHRTYVSTITLDKPEDIARVRNTNVLEAVYQTVGGQIALGYEQTGTLTGYSTQPSQQNSGYEFYMIFPMEVKQYFIPFTNTILENGNTYVATGIIRTELTQTTFDIIASRNPATANAVPAEAGTTTPASGIISNGSTLNLGTIALSSINEKINLNNITALMQSTCEDGSCTQIYPNKFWNNTAWTITDLQGQTATIPLPSETYLYTPFFNNTLSYNMTVLMENFYNNTFINSAIMNFTVTRPVPERTTIIRTLNSNWISGNDYYPNTNNVIGNYFSYLTNTTGHTDLILYRNTSDPMPTASTYIYKTTTAANSNFVMNFAPTPTFTFTITYTINNVTQTLTVPSGATNATIDYSTNTGVILGRNEMILTFNLPNPSSLGISTITTNLPLEYDIVDKRLMTIANTGVSVDATSTFTLPSVPPESNYFKVDGTYKALTNNVGSVEFLCPKTSKNFGDIRLIAGGQIGIRGAYTLSPNSIQIWGPIGTQRISMKKISQFCDANALRSGPNWRFILRKEAGGQGEGYNTVQYIDNL